MIEDDIKFLENLANRLAKALYYGKVHEIGGGAVSPGLMHDDYDRLRKIAKNERGPERQFAHELNRKALPWSANDNLHRDRS